ncbi:MAG: alpha/beta hydrolase [Psychromonas sp.]
MTATITTQKVTYQLGNLTLAGISCGDRQDNIVLCLHGWLDNAASFEPLFPYFNDKHIIAIDLFGHGLSSHRSQDANYHFIDWIDDLLHLFTHNKWSSIDIIGHSMGGMVASAFAAAFPEKVESLTLIDSIGFICTDKTQTTAQLRRGLLSRLRTKQLTAKKTKTKGYTTLDAAINARMMASDLSFEQAGRLVRRGTVQQDALYVWRVDNRVKAISPYRLSPEQAQQLIADINCPVLLIYGTSGLDLVSTGLKQFAPLFKNLQIAELSGGHHVHMQKPAQTVALINQFIDNNYVKE